MTAIVTQGDAARLLLPDESVDLVVTSPPYFGLRSYQDGCATCSGTGHAAHPDSYRIKVCRDCGDETNRMQCNHCGGRVVTKTVGSTEQGPDCPDCDGKGSSHYEGQVGDEATPAEYLDALIACTAEWCRVLKPGGSIFVNLGDRYAGSSSGDRNNGFNERWGNSPGRQAQERSQTVRTGAAGLPAKSLVGLPWRYAIRCIDELGLILRAEIVWAKPNGLPESVTDRVRRSHEQVFHLTKQPRYYSAVDEVRETYSERVQDRQRYAGRPTSGRSYAPGDRNDQGRAQGILGFGADGTNPLGKLPGSVWTIPTAPLTVPDHLGVDHFAAYPPELVRRIVRGWSPREVCTVCGEGRRPTSTSENQPTQKTHTGYTRGALFDRQYGFSSVPHRKLTTLTGYACACPDTTPPTTPGIVLDPFGGTGTTALVASALGRVGISVDLSADYCRLARWRTTDPGERARALEVDKPPVQVDGQLGLFEDLEAVPRKPSGGLAYAEKRGRDCSACGYRTQYAGPTCDRCGAERPAPDLFDGLGG